MSRRLQENIDHVSPESIQHGPTDDLESSIWVILYELYTHASKQGSNRLSKRQLSVFNRLRHRSSDMMSFGKSEIAARVAEAIPQCPPLNAFIAAVFARTNKVLSIPRMGNSIHEFLYQQYFLALLVCLDSNHATLDQTWNDLFPVHEPETEVPFST